MKKILILFLVFYAFSCNKKAGIEIPELITQKVPELKDSLMTPESMWYFGRIGEIVLTQDKKNVIMQVTFYDIDQNRGN